MLSAIFIKGFKTFARPVRMPLEGGITAVVGPNGSGKSNITDAVLFALGEQSPGVLRAGAMGDLIFSGSESLPAAGAAEVTLVFDNGSGEISLPYREVSVTRRISRDGSGEYRINGSRVRLSDVRAVAGEIGLGRHSILRQGAVDAIVAGGADACRLALEEAAGLGVYRRRRLSASRRLERADAQLERSRQLEAELAGQLKRIEREAVAAREYRDLESRYRELSLAHLYRAATRELDGPRRRLKEGEARVAELVSRERELQEMEGSLERRTIGLEGELRRLEVRLERLEDVTEGLRSESLRTDRSLLRLEAARGGEGDRRRSLSRLEDELRRVSRGLEKLEGQVVRVERERSARREELARRSRALGEARERGIEAQKMRSRLAADLESLRARLERGASEGGGRAMTEKETSRLAETSAGLEELAATDFERRLGGLRELARSLRARVEAHDAESSRRRGALSAAVGRVESRVRALREAAPGGGPRLYEVIRARAGFEVAVEAALGEFGAGFLAQNVDEGVRGLSSTERVAVRLDARGVEENGVRPGVPLLECVEVLDGRYAEAVERLLAGIYVVERPGEKHLLNGHVAVTRDGLRLTRTSVSLPAGGGGFARETRLAAGLRLLDDLKNGPGGLLYDLREEVSNAASRLEPLDKATRTLSALAGRAERARSLLVREAARRRVRAEKARRDSLERARAAATLEREASSRQVALVAAERAVEETQRELSSAAAASDAAHGALEEANRRRRQVGAAISEGRRRQARLSAELDRARRASGGGADLTPNAARRAAAAAKRLSDAIQERRSDLRLRRAEKTEAHRRASAEQASLGRRSADVRGELAAARAHTERLGEELGRAEESASGAAEEIREEWGATVEEAGREARKHPEDSETERNRLARKLKRFGDVNLLALSQESELRERHRFVAGQRADAEAAAGELNRIIQSIDKEIEGRFSETFRGVRQKFGEIVPRMMEGASGVLDLSEEGVEIGLRLGRKGWRSLRVLSGGERSLLALSFLFSILLSRGGFARTFCILDEAEAALDDVNLARFLSVVDSHRANGQFLLVTHQKRTMAAADVLYGAVQDASGATAVVSKRMQGE